MSRLCIETRGIASWRDRLASPDTQWERKFSAFETAVSWEGASRSESGLPQPIVALFSNSVFGVPTILFAIAEHKVPLRRRGGDSQCDVWALLQTEAGGLSLSVEAKAREPFGQGNESLRQWLDAGKRKSPRQTVGVDRFTSRRICLNPQARGTRRFRSNFYIAVPLR